MELTERGLTNTGVVLDLLFQYIRLIAQAGPLEWVWQEAADLAAMRFR